MSKRASIPTAAIQELKVLLAERSGLEHLEVRPRGKALTLCSDGQHGLEKHAKLTWLGGQLWALSLPTHTGRWEKTPFTGAMPELFQTLTQMLGFHLAAR